MLQGQEFNIWASILNALIPIVVAGLTGLLAWLSKQVNTWLVKKSTEAQTGENAAWYATAFNLAGIAVKFAETKFGPDTGTGIKKKAEATEWLTQRLLSMDPNLLKNTPNLNGLIAGFIDAAYHDVFVAISPLASSQAANGTTK